MAKILKKMLASQVVASVKDADGAVFVNVSPMTVELSTRLRGFLATKAGGARLRVLHNRTAKAALKEVGWPEKVGDILKGPTAMVYGGEGANVIAKSLAEWSKQDKTLVVKGAIADGEFFDAKGVAALAKMPDKRTMRAMMLSGFLGSARGLATLIQAPGAGLARVLQARIDQQSKQEAPAPAEAAS